MRRVDGQELQRYFLQQMEARLDGFEHDYVRWAAQGISLEAMDEMTEGPGITLLRKHLNKALAKLKEIADEMPEHFRADFDAFLKTLHPLGVASTVEFEDDPTPTVPQWCNRHHRWNPPLPRAATCEACTCEMDRQATGRPAKFCSKACRQAHYRWRRRAAREWVDIGEPF